MEEEEREGKKSRRWKRRRRSEGRMKGGRAGAGRLGRTKASPCMVGAVGRWAGMLDGEEGATQAGGKPGVSPQAREEAGCSLAHQLPPLGEG